MLLSLRDIARVYGPRLIFRDVSFDVRRGSVTLLAGANGAGKSTLLKIMAGLLRPSAGEVIAHHGGRGKEIRIGYLGHRTFLYPGLSALENLRFWAGLHGLDHGDATLADILERMELAPFAGEKAGTFSRGMAQRLNLARVFLLAPDLLLLDEPGTGLDTRSTAVLDREIRACRAAGSGIVWITHNPAFDAGRADMVALLAGKGLRFYGPAADFLSSRPDPALPPTGVSEARC
jgi:heme exporter protein A